MSDVAAARKLIQEAFPIGPGKNAKARIWEAYRELKLRSVRRARAIWTGEARRIDAYEQEALQRAALNRARREHQKSLDRIQRYKAALRIYDEDFHSPQIDALERMVGTKNSTLE